MNCYILHIFVLKTANQDQGVSFYSKYLSFLTQKLRIHLFSNQFQVSVVEKSSRKYFIFKILNPKMRIKLYVQWQVIYSLQQRINYDSSIFNLNIKIRFILIYLLMAKANSFKSEPWTALEKGSFSYFDDDFVHQKLAVFKLTKKSNDSNVTLKQSISEKSGKLVVNNELKFWFPFRERRTLYGVFKQNGYKFHYDHGTFNHNGFLFNFYGSINTNKTLGDLKFKVGLETKFDDVAVNFRLRKQGNKSITLSNKTSFSKGLWNYGFINSYDLLNRVWNLSGLQVGWENGDNHYYLRSNGGSNLEKVNPQRFFENITLDLIHKHSNSNFSGLEVKGNLITKALQNLSAVWLYKCVEQGNTVVKVKADLHRQVAISVKNHIKGYGSYIFGVQILDFGQTNRFSYGVQLDLNI